MEKNNECASQSLKRLVRIPYIKIITELVQPIGNSGIIAWA